MASLIGKQLYFFQAFEKRQRPGSEQAAEKVQIWANLAESVFPWLKSALILLALCGG
jgi:hypothetical protein